MKLNFKELGEGKPLVIVHGLFGSLDNWITLGKQFAQEGYHVYLIDQRNHGKSPHDDAFNYSVMAQDLHEFIGTHVDGPVQLIGHSMGGKTAMTLAANQAEILHKLVVVDIGPKYYPPHHSTILEALNAVDPSTLTSRGDGEAIMKKIISDPGVRMFLLKNLVRTSGNQFSWKMNLPVIADHIEEVGAAQSELGSVDTRTLFIHGANSDYIEKADKADIRSQFKNSTFVEIAGAGHWVHAEQADSFFKTVNHFLRDD